MSAHPERDIRGSWSRAQPRARRWRHPGGSSLVRRSLRVLQAGSSPEPSRSALSIFPAARCKFPDKSGYFQTGSNLHRGKISGTCSRWLCLISSGSVKMSCPATCPLPEVGVMMPQSMRMVVDFPAPFGPRKPKISPLPDRKGNLVDGDKAAEALFQISERQRLQMSKCSPEATPCPLPRCDGSWPLQGWKIRAERCRRRLIQNMGVVHQR